MVHLKVERMVNTAVFLWRYLKEFPFNMIVSIGLHQSTGSASTTGGGGQVNSDSPYIHIDYGLEI